MDLFVQDTQFFRDCIDFMEWLHRFDFRITPILNNDNTDFHYIFASRY